MKKKTKNYDLPIQSKLNKLNKLKQLEIFFHLVYIEINI
jgi:hypothetical protein